MPSPVIAPSTARALVTALRARRRRPVRGRYRARVRGTARMRGGSGAGHDRGGAIALPEDPVCHGSVGRLVARTQAVIVDPDSGVPLGEGGTGELWVRGPQLMRGYLGNEAASAATADPDGWLHTGDLGLRRRRQSVPRRSPQGAHQGPRRPGGARPARGRADRASGRGRRCCHAAGGRGLGEGPGGLRRAVRGGRARRGATADRIGREGATDAVRPRAHPPLNGLTNGL